MMTSKKPGIEKGEKGRRNMGRLMTLLNPMQTGTEAGKLESDLRRRIVGQDEAIEQIVSIYQTYLAGMSSPGRPVGNLLFLGPTGSGKTRLVEATAESLAGDCRAMIKIDCAELQHSHEIAKLIGSPPGYLGHRETHPLLSQEALNQYHTERMKLSFVLFDEIEKASDALWNLLLGILDKATLTLGDNRRVDFSHALIFMTSNLGAGEMNSILRPNLGFAPRNGAPGRVMEDKLADKIARAGVEAARRKFSPEFMNRIDKTVVFRPLGDAELWKILQLELGFVQQRLFDSAREPFVFAATADAQEFLLREGTDVKYGARHLKRAIDRHLVHPLSNLMASGQVHGGDLVRVGYDPAADQLTFAIEEEEMSAGAMAQRAGIPVTLPMGAYTAPAVAEQPRTLTARTSKRMA